MLHMICEEFMSSGWSWMLKYAVNKKEENKIDSIGEHREKSSFILFLWFAIAFVVFLKFLHPT